MRCDDLPIFQWSDGTSTPLEDAPIPTVAPDYPETTSTTEMFAEYHRRNPAVYRALLTLAYDLRRRGRKGFGMRDCSRSFGGSMHASVARTSRLS